MIERVKKIFGGINEADAILIINGAYPQIDMTFFYVTGFENGLFENSAAVLYPDGKVEVICPELEKHAAEKNVSTFSTGQEKMGLLKEKINGKRIGINGKSISYANFIKLGRLFPEANFFDVEHAIRKARMVKDNAEIETIKKACTIAANVSHKISSYLEDNVKECDVLAEINYQMEKEGAAPSFDTIVAFGKNSSLPHYSTGRKKFEFPALIDFGARYKRYCSDMTRTFISENSEQKKAYELVREGQEMAFDMIEEGIKAGDVHNAVDELFVKKGRGRMIHSVGHSLGLEVHDGFSMHRKNETLLREGTVLTIEPGIYLKDRWGIRIEDDVLVKKNGIEILTKK
ncbi:MAG: Xaa-Pro peptidase family protein [Candidatus Thermoplasmatota archaeon]|nr:Xaa-Pro peptidase family protein [Candidatus Thermoplasmatota archaeon]